MRSTSGATGGAGTTNQSGAHELTFGFRGVRAAQSLVFWVVFCLSLFVCLSFFPFFGTLSVLLLTASD